MQETRMSCKCALSQAAFADGVDQGAWLTLKTIIAFWSEHRGDTYQLETLLLQLQETLKPEDNA
jgi:hypothetical protein